MNRFRYYLDFNSGFELINPVNNKLSWIKKNDINPVIYRIELKGSFVLIQADYDKLIAYKNLGYSNYIKIKIEQYSNISKTWNNIFEGVSDMRNDFNNVERTITLTNFVNSNDNYNNLISNYSIKSRLDSLYLTSYQVKLPLTQSTSRYAVKVAGTGLTATAYKLMYMPSGHWYYNVSTTPHNDWSVFLYLSTDADGSHNFETTAFDFEPKDSQFLYTTINLLVNGEYKKLFCLLPPSAGSFRITERIAANRQYKFTEVINELLNLASSTITFDENTATTYIGLFSSGYQYTYFDFKNYLIGESSDYGGENFKGSVISLKMCFDYMAQMFDMHWYIDGTALKFKHITEIGTGYPTIDLTNETKYLNDIIYLNEDIPDVETFFTEDSKGAALETGTSDHPFGKFQIFYRDGKNDVKKNIIKENQIKINTNVKLLLALDGKTDKNQFIISEMTDNISNPRILRVTSDVFNDRLTSFKFFEHLSKYRFDNEAKLATRFKFALISLGEIASRPLKKIKNIYINRDLLTDFNVNSIVLTTHGNSFVEQIEQQLNTDAIKLDVKF